MTRLRGLPVAAAVAIVTFLAFVPTLENGFVDWDDQYNFLLNESYRGLGWTQLQWMFTAFHLGHYAPLTWITFGADYLVWGLDPFGYHLTNLLVHTANAVVFYLIAVRLLSAAAPDAASRPLPLRFVAALAALVFAIHPLRVESVAWATERKDVLSALFYLLAVLVYLRRQEVPSGRPAVRRRRYWVCFFLFVLALLSKSMAVTMPAVLLLLDIHNYGFLIAQIFFGLWLAPLGYLAYKSGLFPRALGVVLVVATVSYLVDVLAAFSSPDLAKQIHPFLIIAPTVGEIGMVVYLLVWGVRTPTAREHAPIAPSGEATIAR